MQESGTVQPRETREGKGLDPFHAKILGVVTQKGSACPREVSTLVDSPADAGRKAAVRDVQQAMDDLVQMGRLQRLKDPKDGRDYSGPRSVYEPAV